MTFGRSSRFGRAGTPSTSDRTAFLSLQMPGRRLERNLFRRLWVSDQALACLRSYKEKKITAPSRSIEA